MATIYEIYGTDNYLLFEEENILKYCKGGYHPVELNEKFKQGRYQICHKLGFGGSSTVWLAKDHLKQKWVSLKILTGNRTENPRELDALRDLQSCDSVVKLLDEFKHTGPNGIHQCLVFELLGPRLDMLIDKQHEDGGIKPGMVVKTTKDVLELLDALHGANYAHGDLSPSNIAVQAPRLASLPDAAIYKLLGEPVSDELVRLDGAPLSASLPTEIIQTTEWEGWPDEDLGSLSNASLSSGDDVLPPLRLIDLGEAFPIGDHPSTLAQILDLQAPEIIFTDKLGYKADLWRVGLTIYYIVLGGMPFLWINKSALAAFMIGFVGDLPTEWQRRWSEMKQASLDPNRLDEQQQLFSGRKSLAERLLPIKNDPQLSAVASVIEGLLRLAPAERLSASKALEIMTSIQHR